MAFNTYAQGLKIASDIASRAIAAESSLPSLPRLASPLPTLQRAFQLYVSAAEAYSHLLQSSLVPAADKSQVQRKWRLVLDRADKVKRRIEELGGRVGNADTNDEAEESAVCRRSSQMNGFVAEPWRGPPPDREFESSSFRDTRQPELAEEQIALDPEWAEPPSSAWEVPLEGKWKVRQGPGADCSVTAGIGACLAHNARWGTKLCQDALYPQAMSGQPKRSENAKHVVKLLLNGAWRSVVIDALLPRAKRTHAPLHITARRKGAPQVCIGPAWIPVAVKGYFKALGGYSIPGSDPAPDVYAFTGWIPERLDLNSGFQREKEWNRLFSAWNKGDVIVTLGSGREVAPGLVPHHAYGVTDIKDDGGERILRIFNPGSSKSTVPEIADELGQVHLGEGSAGGAYSFTMSWDEACSKFQTLNLNWNPALLPVVVERHWSWAKSEGTGEDVNSSSLETSPRFRVVATPSQPNSEIWLLLSQHDVSRDVPLEAVALHVFREYRARGRNERSRLVSPAHEEQNPYTNALHTLVRYPLREGENVLNAIPSRDKSQSQMGFTLRAFASPGTELSLTRVSLKLPFSATIASELTKRSAGGHQEFPTHHRNPQYKLTVSPSSGNGRKGAVRLCVKGTTELAWNVKLLWGQGERVFELASETIVASSGPYSYGMAYCEVEDLEVGTYTVLVSSYERDQPGQFSFTVESALPVALACIAQEGAGMFSRTVTGRWDSMTAGGRPSNNQYDRNPRVEVTLPKPATLLSRLLLLIPAPVPINLTVFKRGTGGSLGEQVGTSGPYVERVSGVSVGKTKVAAGTYVLVPSTYEAGVMADWSLDIWADAPFSAELCRPS